MDKALFKVGDQVTFSDEIISLRPELLPIQRIKIEDIVPCEGHAFTQCSSCNKVSYNVSLVLGVAMHGELIGEWCEWALTLYKRQSTNKPKKTNAEFRRFIER